MRRARMIAVAVTMILTSSAAIAPAVTLADDRSNQGTNGHVTFDGQRIDALDSIDLSCHDIEAPVVRCFLNAAEMLTDLKRSLGSTDRAAVIAATGYVIAYEHTYFGGAARAMSVDYDDLSDIGWNDRISSYKSFGASGHFREHSPPAGFNVGFGTSSQVSVLGSAFNDKFSALQLD